MADEKGATDAKGAPKDADDELPPTAGAGGSRVENTRGLVTMVCITCGNEKFFADKMPGALRCERCGGTVFRQFDTPTAADEATLSQLEEQARSIQWGDASPQTSADEARDVDS